MYEDVLQVLNAPSAGDRLLNLSKLLPMLSLPPIGADVNNHIHTTFSFSPYSPTAAAWMARASGLCTAGIMDHDTIMGAREFLQAAGMLGIGGTCGVECRVSFDGTPLAGRRINNPDQRGVAYILLHAVPHTEIETVDAFFAPLREKRNDRNRAMVARLNEMLAGTGVAGGAIGNNRAPSGDSARNPCRVDFTRDVLPLSEVNNGGAVTERHISSALATALTERAGRGAALVAFLEKTFDRKIGEKYRQMFCDAANPYFHYDLIGWIKAELIPAFYIDATDECANVRDVLALSERVGAISAYAYLGDIGDSVTGDKRAQAFEDGYLDELFGVIVDLGFRAVTYMPARNTMAQLQRVRGLIHKNGLFEISGEDINQPRQQFVCMAMRDPGFDALKESAWAMIAHERQPQGLFSEAAVGKWPDLADRVAAFARMGRRYAKQ